MKINLQTASTCILSLICILVAFVYLFFIGNNPDHEGILYFSRRILNGDVFYNDIIGLNPPLIFYIYLIPSYLSKIIGTPTEYVLDLFTFALIGVSLLYCNVIMSGSESFNDKKSRSLVLAIIATGLIFFATFGVRGNFVNVFFADRDHLLCVLALPYFLISMPLLRNAKVDNKHRIIISILAGIGFCIKPQFSIIWLVPNIFLVANEKSFWKVFLRLENIIIYLVAIAYISLVMLFYPEYVFQILPMITDYYSNNGTDSTMRMLYILYLFVLPYFSFMYYTQNLAKNNEESPMRVNILYLFSLVMAGMALVFIGAGWPNSFYVFKLFIFFAVCLLVYEFYNAKKSTKDVKLSKKYSKGFNISMIGVAYICFISAISIHKDVKYNLKEPPQYITKMQEYIENNAESGKFMYISSAMYPWDSTFATAEDNKKISVQRFQSYYHFMMPFYRKFLEQNEMQKVVFDKEILNDRQKYFWRFITDSTAEDVKKEPDIIIIQNHMDGISVEDFFIANEMFAKEWKNYQYVEKLDFCSDDASEEDALWCYKFDIYKRKLTGS